MAIRDFLRACPLCGRDEALRSARRSERCSACGARFRRVAGSRIRAERPGQEPETRSASEWDARLPPVPLPDAAGPEPIRTARVAERRAVGEQSVFRGRSFLGRIERFGTDRHGELRLFPDAIQFTPREGQGWRWHFDRLTAVQPSSSALQLKASGEPVVSLRFPDSSVRLWEDLVQETLRAFYRRTGRGEIVEMQPRIIARP